MSGVDSVSFGPDIAVESFIFLTAIDGVSLMAGYANYILFLMD